MGGSIDATMDRRMGRSIDRLVVRSKYPLDPSIQRSSLSIGLSIDRLFHRSIDRSVSRLIDRSIE
eukprot:3817720-Lingulodinium_polyedra.AAC.1